MHLLPGRVVKIPLRAVDDDGVIRAQPGRHGIRRLCAPNQGSQQQHHTQHRQEHPLRQFLEPGLAHHSHPPSV
jgi:hypothetical protein